MRTWQQNTTNMACHNETHCMCKRDTANNPCCCRCGTIIPPPIKTWGQTNCKSVTSFTSNELYFSNDGDYYKPLESIPNAH